MPAWQERQILSCSESFFFTPITFRFSSRALLWKSAERSNPPFTRRALVSTAVRNWANNRQFMALLTLEVGLLIQLTRLYVCIYWPSKILREKSLKHLRSNHAELWCGS